MTLEEAQARIIELEETVTTLTNERDTLSQNNESLSGELERVRTLNQQYFNKLTAMYNPTPPETDEPDSEPVSCEEFAKTLNI